METGKTFLIRRSFGKLRIIFFFLLIRENILSIQKVNNCNSKSAYETYFKFSTNMVMYIISCRLLCWCERVQVNVFVSPLRRLANIKHFVCFFVKKVNIRSHACKIRTTKGKQARDAHIKKLSPFKSRAMRIGRSQSSITAVYILIKEADRCRLWATVMWVRHFGR